MRRSHASCTAWLRLSHADTSSAENLGGWLTQVVGVARLASYLQSTSPGADLEANCLQVPDAPFLCWLHAY